MELQRNGTHCSDSARTVREGGTQFVRERERHGECVIENARPERKAHSVERSIRGARNGDHRKGMLMECGVRNFRKEKKRIYR